MAAAAASYVDEDDDEPLTGVLREARRAFKNTKGRTPPFAGQAIMSTMAMPVGAQTFANSDTGLKYLASPKGAMSYSASSLTGGR